MSRTEALTREVLPALGIAAVLGCLIMVTEIRHQARWHPQGIGRARCEAGHCASRGSARARWKRRLGLEPPEPPVLAVPRSIVDHPGYRGRGSQRLDAVLD